MKSRRLSPMLPIVCLTLCLAAWAVQAFAIPGNPPDGAFDWVQTPSAILRTASGDCFDPNASVQEVCVEFCVITHDGDVLPQGQFRCMPFNG